MSCASPRAPETVVPSVPDVEAGGPTSSAAPPPVTIDAAPPVAEPAQPPPAPGIDPATPSYAAPLGPADHDFALRFYATQRNTRGNLFLSPTSLRVALAMVYAGARGETASQMGRALGFASDVGTTSDYFAALLKEWNAGKDPKIKLKVVNRLWGRKDLRLVPAFSSGMAKQFAAPVELLDFEHALEPSRRKINSWVEDRTEHLIKDLLQPGDLPGETRLVVTNAIYFKGKWSLPFAVKETVPGAFHVAPGKDVTAPLMHQEARFAYAETSDAKFLALPYGLGDMSMLVVLPQQNFGLGDLEASLDAAALDAAVAKMQKTLVKVTLPKFSTTFRTSLKAALVAMGMPLAFTDQADFSAMAETALKVDEVFQKAFVKVDETGTEAAAATGAVMIPLSLTVPRVFVADHPFLYAIRDRAGNLLFLGRFIDPTA